MIINQYLTHMVITPGEFLVRAGEIASAMYFVISGELCIINEQGAHVMCR
jgi:hypothetical protein